MNKKQARSYAQGLLAALAEWDGDERFGISEIEVAGTDCLLLTCQDAAGDDKPVALVLVEGTDTLEALCAAAVAQVAAEAAEAEQAAAEAEGEGEEAAGNGAEPEDDPDLEKLVRDYVKEMVGKVTRKGKAKPDWSP